MLEYNIGTNLSDAYLDVQAKLNTILNQLPDGAERPSILKLDTQSQPTMYLSLTGNRPAYELRDLADNFIKDRLSSVPGVAGVAVAGGEKREIQVLVDKQRLNAYGLSINTIVRTLQGANLNVPAGRITEGERDYNVRLLGEFASIEELRELEIFLPNNRNPMARQRDSPQGCRDSARRRGRTHGGHPRQRQRGCHVGHPEDQRRQRD